MRILVTANTTTRTRLQTTAGTATAAKICGPVSAMSRFLFAVIDDSGIHTEAQDQQIEEEDAEEILRIVKEQQLITRVKEYEELLDEEVYDLDEIIYQISFAFADGSTIDAPIDAGNEPVHGFYQLAKRIGGK